MKKIQLSIPEPCHQNWDDMTPTQQGRFCNACAKQVIDFTQMSDSEVLNYFSIVKNTTICGQAYPDQLNRTIKDSPTKKLRWYWNYVIAFFLLFSKSTNTKAQGMVRIVKSSGLKRIQPLNLHNTFKQPEPINGFIVQGIVVDENWEAIPFSSIRLPHSNQGISADEDGKFQLKVDGLPCMIEISALNFETKQVEVNNLLEKKMMLAKTKQLMKEIVINSTEYTLRGRVGGMIISCKTEGRNIIKDTIQNWLTALNPTVQIYPNPILKGGAFTVSLKLKQTGLYTIQIIDATGSILLERKINAAAKKYNEQLFCSNTWSGGIYYLRVMDDKGRFIGTGNIAIQ